MVLATLALLAVVTRPVWGSSGMSKSLLCMDNLRRLQTAWLLYTTENQGVMPGNYSGELLPTATERPWVWGWLGWDTRPDNTNTTYFTQSRYAPLAVYLDHDVTVYRCPADEYVSAAQGAKGWPPRARSYAMNCFMGEGNAPTIALSNPRYTFYRRLSDFRTRSPQQAFVFLEEHPDSINDALFWAPNTPADAPWKWLDVPGSFHDGACWFSFADGHLEARTWTNLKLTPPVTTVGLSGKMEVPPGDPDTTWFLQHASELR